MAGIPYVPPVPALTRLERRIAYGGRKGRSAARKLARLLRITANVDRLLAEHWSPAAAPRPCPQGTTADRRSVDDAVDGHAVFPS
jgi:hypothetical protein